MANNVAAPLMTQANLLTAEGNMRRRRNPTEKDYDPAQDEDMLFGKNGLLGESPDPTPKSTLQKIKTLQVKNKQLQARRKVK